MVSAKTVITIGALAGIAAAYVGLGGASGIGSRIGGAFSDFGKALTNPFGSDSFGTTSGSAAERGQTIEGIVKQNNLEAETKNVPDKQVPLSDIEKGRLTFAQFLQDQGLGGRIDLKTGIFENRFTRQPLDFTIGREGRIKTGTSGLGETTLAAQQALSDRFGIPTFDVKGNLSTFGGLAAAFDR